MVCTPVLMRQSWDDGMLTVAHTCRAQLAAQYPASITCPVATTRILVHEAAVGFIRCCRASPGAVFDNGFNE